MTGRFANMVQELYPTLFVCFSPVIESSLESHADMESSAQPGDDASLPSTSQDPGKSCEICLPTII